MITEFALIISLLFSSIVPSNAQLGSDMSDEDFELFVDMHFDLIDTAWDFAKNNHILAEAGGLSTLLAAVIKMSIKHPIANLAIGGAASALIKDLYEKSFGNKDQRISELEKQLTEVVKEINIIKAKQLGNEMPSYGDFSCGHGHELKSENTANDIRSSNGNRNIDRSGGGRDSETRDRRERPSTDGEINEPHDGEIHMSISPK